MNSLFSDKKDKYKKSYTESKQSGNFQAFIGVLYFKNHFAIQSRPAPLWMLNGMH